MKKKTTSKKEAPEINVLDRVRHDIEEMSRDWWLTGLGAVSVVTEEGLRIRNRMTELLEGGISIEAFKNRLEEETSEWTERTEKLHADLVEKGRRFEKDQRDALDKFVQSIRSKSEEVQESVTEKISDPVEDLFGTVQEKVTEIIDGLEIPSIEEFGKITEKLSDLAAKVEKLTLRLETEVETASNTATKKTPAKKAPAKTAQK